MTEAVSGYVLSKGEVCCSLDTNQCIQCILESIKPLLLFFYSLILKWVKSNIFPINLQTKPHNDKWKLVFYMIQYVLQINRYLIYICIQTLCYETWLSSGGSCFHWSSINQLHLFVKPFLHQLMSQSAVQKPSLKPQTASNAGVEAWWLGKLPRKAET